MSAAPHQATIYKYPSGNPGVIVNETDSNPHYLFLDDTNSKSAHALTLAAFQSGVGFVNHNGRTPSLPRVRAASFLGVVAVPAVVGAGYGPAFTSTLSRGRVCDARGEVLDFFDWSPKKPGAGSGPKGGSLRINVTPSLTFACNGKFEMEMTFRGASGIHVFDLSFPHAANGTYLDHCFKTLTGKLELTVHAQTLSERQTAMAVNPAAQTIAKAQMFGWPLPRMSPSGRECEAVQLRPDLKDLVSDANEQILHIKEYRTEVGRNVDQSLDTIKSVGKTLNLSKRRTGKLLLQDGDEPESNIDQTTSPSTALSLSLSPLLPLHSSSFSSSPTKGLSVPSATYQRAVPPPSLPPIVKGSKMLDFVKGEALDQLIVCCCSDRGTTECRKAEKELAIVHRDHCSSLAATKRSEKSGGADFKVVLVDCSKQPDVVAKTFNFNVYPMYFMFMAGKLCFIGNKFNGFSTYVEDFLIEIQKAAVRAKRGDLLVDDFRFLSPRNATIDKV